MVIKFLGTGAATAMPLPFCRCALCKKARIAGGKNLRKRSSLLIDDELLIDLSPDFMSACFENDMDETKIKYLVQTHAHSDHFDAGHMVVRLDEYKTENPSLLTVIASDVCIDAMSKATDLDEGVSLRDEKQLSLKLMPVNAFETVWANDYKITALPAEHDERAGSQIYLIEKYGKTLLYALDTKCILDSVYKYIEENNIKIDVAVMDHTYGKGIVGGGHMSADDVRESVKKLKCMGAFTELSKVFASHISHEGNKLHDEMKNDYYEIAYDGLQVNIYSDAYTMS